MNIGVRKFLTKTEIKNGHIENNIGKKLLSVLGINNEKICQVFNKYSNKEFMNIENDTVEIEQDSAFADEMYQLILQAVSKDYWMLHKIGNEVKFYWINDILPELYPKSCIVYYGGKSGEAKRVDVIVQTSKMELNFNIRNKESGIYPTHIMCDYKYL